MASEGYHEEISDLTDDVRDMHRAIVSLMEELEAADWYNQRVSACKNDELKAILAHNRDEEKEHAAMLIEWIRRRDSKFDDELRDYLHMCRDEGWWDEESVTAHVRLILDRHLGPPPEEFEYEGRKMSPTDFFRDVIRLDTSEYVQIMSTLSVPFHTMTEFDVPDNWRPTATYYNLPLDDFCRYIGKAARSGYTVCIGGDVSEPGYYGEEDAAVVPTFDIPFEYIDQDSRELRIYNGTTEDDHGVHLLAVTEAGDRDWFLIKDSARASRRGEHEGYIFYREDYVRLKMLTCMVHSDVLEEIIDRVEKARKQVGMRSSTRDLAY